MIPVQRPYLGEEELEGVRKVFDSRWLGLGSVTKEFEERLREIIGARHVVAVNTGTSAIHVALDALHLHAGDEVIVPSLTYVASVQAIVAAGARPVFCEIEPETLNIDVDDALSRVTPRTKVIMPVHYGGLVCDMDRLLPAAHDRGLRVVEDAAHAFGSTYHGRRVGTLGDLTCFSFDPIKNITCIEGGAVTTEDDDLAAEITRKRILGIDNDTWSRYRNERNWFYEVVTPGFRYHMPNVNAAVGLAQLRRCDDFKRRKIEITRRYDEALAGTPGLTLIRHDLDEMFPFFYIARVLDGQRDPLMKLLKERGVASGVHYIPNHDQPLFKDSHVDLPVTERVFEEILTLPMYYELTDNDLEKVIEEVKAGLASLRVLA